VKATNGGPYRVYPNQTIYFDLVAVTGQASIASWSISSGPQKGTVSLSDDNHVTYIAGRKPGNDSFQFTVRDSMGRTATALVTITIPRSTLQVPSLFQARTQPGFSVSVADRVTGGTTPYTFEATEVIGGVGIFDAERAEYTPDEYAIGEVHEFDVTVRDAVGDSKTFHCKIHVIPEPEGPSVSITAYSSGMASQPGEGVWGSITPIRPNDDNDDHPESAANPLPRDNSDNTIESTDDDIVKVHLSFERNGTVYRATSGSVTLTLPTQGFQFYRNTGTLATPTWEVVPGGTTTVEDIDDPGTNLLGTLVTTGGIALYVETHGTTLTTGTISLHTTGTMVDDATGDDATFADGSSTTLLPFEFVTKAEDDDAATVATTEVGPTNQEPILELANIAPGQVTVSGTTATFQVSGAIRDAIMDNVPAGGGADIVKARVFVNDELDREITLARQSDGAPSFWRKHPARLPIPTFTITVPANEGMAVVRIETSPNAAGLKGSAEVVAEFTEHRTPGPLEGGYTRSYSLTLAGSTVPTAVDSVILRGGTETTTHTLTETGPNTLVFASPISSGGTASTLVVRLASPYTANPSTHDAIVCKVSDLEFDGEILSSMPAHLSCTETGANTGVFTYTETQAGFQTYGPASYSLQTIRLDHNQKVGGNHSFSFRTSSVSASPFRHRLGTAEFETLTLAGMQYPRLNPGEKFVGYLVDNESIDPPQRELLYYDSRDSQLHRVEVYDSNDVLALSVVVGTAASHLGDLLSGELEFVGPDGFPVETTSHVSAQTLVDLIAGDTTVEIDDDSWDRAVVRIFGSGADVRVRVQSSEVESDYFELMVNPPATGKLAALMPIGETLYQSELKIVVYESTPEIATLSDAQWHALKGKGYLAIHNASGKLKKTVGGGKAAVATNRGQFIRDHPLFPRNFRPQF